MCLWTEHGKKKKQKKSGHKKGKGDKLGQHAESQASLASDEGNGATDVSVSACLLQCVGLLAQTVGKSFAEAKRIKCVESLFSFLLHPGCDFQDEQDLFIFLEVTVISQGSFLPCM